MVMVVGTFRLPVYLVYTLTLSLNISFVGFSMCLLSSICFLFFLLTRMFHVSLTRLIDFLVVVFLKALLQNSRSLRLSRN